MYEYMYIRSFIFTLFTFINSFECHFLELKTKIADQITTYANDLFFVQLQNLLF